MGSMSDDKKCIIELNNTCMTNNQTKKFGNFLDFETNKIININQ